MSFAAQCSDNEVWTQTGAVSESNTRDIVSSFQLLHISLCSDVVSPKAQSRSPEGVHNVQMHVLRSMKYNLLYYYPAGLSLTWLRNDHWLGLAKTCRHPPSSRPEPQSVTASSSYCSTVQPCAAIAPSPHGSLHQSLLYCISSTTLSYIHPCHPVKLILGAALHWGLATPLMSSILSPFQAQNEEFKQWGKPQDRFCCCRLLLKVKDKEEIKIVTTARQ